jgi:hypothetical protein
VETPERHHHRPLATAQTSIVLSKQRCEAHTQNPHNVQHRELEVMTAQHFNSSSNRTTWHQLLAHWLAAGSGALLLLLLSYSGVAQHQRQYRTGQWPTCLATVCCTVYTFSRHVAQTSVCDTTGLTLCGSCCRQLTSNPCGVTPCSVNSSSAGQLAAIIATCAASTQRC